MKYWEKIKEPITKAETPWFVKFMWCVGFVIGFFVIGSFIAVTYLMFGFLLSLIWNFAVAPVFDVNELTSYTGAALLFLFFTAVKVAKWLFK
tara:strand:+ start:799 stop:1074 length:276 start_codon:yes stop_codon:yes gene_type:complete